MWGERAAATYHRKQGAANCARLQAQTHLSCGPQRAWRSSCQQQTSATRLQRRSVPWLRKPTAKGVQLVPCVGRVPVAADQQGIVESQKLLRT